MNNSINITRNLKDSNIINNGRKIIKDRIYYPNICKYINTGINFIILDNSKKLIDINSYIISQCNSENKYIICRGKNIESIEDYKRFIEGISMNNSILIMDYDDIKFIYNVRLADSEFYKNFLHNTIIEMRRIAKEWNMKILLMKKDLDSDIVDEDQSTDSSKLILNIKPKWKCIIDESDSSLILSDSHFVSIK